MVCFNCGFEIPVTVENYQEVFECPSCKALYSELISFKDSLAYVLLEYREGKIPFDQVRAFSLFVMITKGDNISVDTRKGWFDPLTKKMVHEEDVEGIPVKGCAMYPNCPGCDSEEIIPENV